HLLISLLLCLSLILPRPPRSPLFPYTTLFRSLKNDAPADPAGVADLWRRLLGLSRDQRVWIAGSTHGGEEEAALAAHAAAAAEQIGRAHVLAPRHPERVDEVLSLIAARGLRAVRRSAMPGGRAAGAIIVVDTVGELAQMYAVADVVFVGGSLVPLGGHNVLEPALPRKPGLMGPHTDNFREAAGLLTASGGALVVRDAASLGFELRRLLADPGLAMRRGEAGFESLAAQHGALRQTLDLVARFLAPESLARSGDAGR